MAEPAPDYLPEVKNRVVHILVLEDEDAHAELIRRSFLKAAEPYRLTIAQNLGEARADLGRETPDLIIADWLLPDGNGIDILPRKDGLAELPVVIMTSHGDENLAVEIMKSGAIDYIVKSESTFKDLPHIALRVLREWENVRERKNAEEALRRSELKYRTLHESMRDAFVSVAMDGQIREYNTAYREMLGYSDEELVRQSYREITPEKWNAYEEKIVQEQILPRGFSDVYRKEYRKKDGTVFPVELRVFLIRDESGRPEGMWAIVRDITGRVLQEKALALANQKLQLMNIIAWHDIQNKVTSLRGYVELSKDLIENKKVTEFLTIEEGILRTIDTQIQYTKEYQEIGMQPPRWIRIPDLVRMTASLMNMGPVRLEVLMDDLELRCDPIIGKVFSHLIGFTLECGKTATEIRISCRETPGNHLTVVYEDNGVGIPEGKKKSIFVRDVAKFHAFGLFFIHDILEISGMEIIETGVPGKGSRFEILVPKGMYRTGGAGDNRD
ncbi:PAS domain S-box protein [Methanoregula sp.]|uniref:PAS domain-containing sensor histidine kinase n=1 Tax=Methanoregula sp. TaxID=2052170 RepID=UPI003C765F98